MPFILESTREALARLAMQHAGAICFNPTGIAGFNVVKRIERGEKRSFQKPYAALIFQGRKRTRVGDIEPVYGPGDVVVTCIDFPSFTTIEEAFPFLRSRTQPRPHGGALPHAWPRSSSGRPGGAALFRHALRGRHRAELPAPPRAL